MLTLQILTLVLLFKGTWEDASHDRVPLIIGGINSNPHEFPFMASILDRGHHICGCTILNPSWVLTAAHCTERVQPRRTQIGYGHSKLNLLKVVGVRKTVTHAGYNSKWVINDISLIQVSAAIRLSHEVKTVQLPAYFEETPGGTPAIAIGWGRLSEGGLSPNNMQKVNLPIVGQRECRALVGNVIYSSNICAGKRNTETDVCHGDSGGPLIVRGKQVGITSWGIEPCAGPVYASVFTKVSHYTKWIADVIKYN